MEYTAILVTAEQVPGAQVVIPIFVDALRQSVKNLCETIQIVNHETLTDTLQKVQNDEVVLVLHTNMPLITEDECRILLQSIDTGGVVYAEQGYQGLVIKNAGDVSIALDELHRRKNDALLASGVLLIDPASTTIDPGVQVGEGTVIYPNNTITGATVIGMGCMLMPNCRIHACNIADEVTIESSVLLESTVGEKTVVGPFAYLRPGNTIGSHCRVGDFVEIKNCTIGDDTKISHLTYVGDSDLGKGINLGCGVVFVNYDGKQKHRSKVSDGAFIGCNVNLVSPVTVGKNAYVAAGSTITENIPEGALAIARAKQSVKEDWVSKRKKEGKL